MIALPARNREMEYSIYEVRDRAETDGMLTLGKCSSLIQTSFASSMPFPWDMLESFNSGDSPPISELIQFELPVLIPAAIGILTSLLVLIVTPCFFCCRCCGRCGAKLQMSDIRKQKRWCMFVTGGFVLLAIGFICFTASSSLESGVVFRKSPRMIFDTVNSSFDDLPAFITNYGKELSSFVTTELNVTLDLMRMQVGDLPNILSAPLTGIAGSVLTGVDNNIQILIEGMNNITALESETNTTLQNIEVLSQSLRLGFTAVNNNLTQMKTQCVTDGETFCDILLDPYNNAAEFNMSELLDMSTVSDLVLEIKSVNLTGIRSLGNESLTSLPDVIHNSSKTAVSGVLEELDRIPGTVLPELDSVLKFTNMTRSTFGIDSTMDSFSDIVDQFDSATTPVMDKVMLPIISSYLGLIAVIAALSVLLGFLFSKRGFVFTSRSTISHMGANCLMCTVVLSILPVMIFMMLSSLLLVLGGNISVICNPLQDLTLIEKLENGYLDLYSDETIKDTFNISFSLKHVFKTCQENGTLYAGFDLGDKFNLSSFINVSSLVPELGSDVYDQINETIRDMNVLDTELLDNLTSSFSFTNITSDHSTQSVKDELLELDLKGLSTNLTDVVPLIPKQTYSDAYIEIAQILMELDKNEKLPLLNSMDDLDGISHKLEAIGVKLENSSRSISNELNQLQQFIQTRATESIFQGIHDFLVNMSTVPENFIDAITDKMTHSVGKCGLLWDIYDSITSSVCNYLLDSLNSFWLSLYVGGLALVILMISSCVIEKYFRYWSEPARSRVSRRVSFRVETRRPSDLTRYQNMSSNAIPSARVDDFSDNVSIIAGSKKTLPDCCYRVVKQKRQKRRQHFFTGEHSPQLLKVRMLSERLWNKNGATVNKDTHIVPDELNNSVRFEADLSNHGEDCHVGTTNLDAMHYRSSDVGNMMTGLDGDSCSFSEDNELISDDKTVDYTCEYRGTFGTFKEIRNNQSKDATLKDVDSIGYQSTMEAVKDLSRSEDTLGKDVDSNQYEGTFGECKNSINIHSKYSEKDAIGKDMDSNEFKGTFGTCKDSSNIHSKDSGKDAIGKDMDSNEFKGTFGTCKVSSNIHSKDSGKDAIGKDVDSNEFGGTLETLKNFCNKQRGHAIDKQASRELHVAGEMPCRVNEGHSTQEAGVSKIIEAQPLGYRGVVQRPTTLSLCPARPHPAYTSDMSAGDRIQCALCKQRDMKTRQNFMIKQSEIKTPTQILDPQTSTCVSRDMAFYIDSKSQSFDNESHVPSSLDGNQYTVSVYRDDCVEKTSNNQDYVNDSDTLLQSDTKRTHFDSTEEIFKTVVHEEADTKYKRGDSLGNLLSEFDTIYRNLALNPLDENRNDINLTDTKRKVSESRPHAKIVADKTKYNAASNRKRVLNIQVKPYTEFYRDKDNVVNTTDMFAKEHRLALSKLASMAVLQLPQHVKGFTGSNEYAPVNLMTAYCGRGQGKTTYL